MILYRARALSTRPSRLPAFEGNEPYIRVRGRWFTSSRVEAFAHGRSTFAPGKWEVISVEVPDAIVDGYRVATTPHTACGLSPIDYSETPESDYILPMFLVMKATPMMANEDGRVRDYILVNQIAIAGRPVALAKAA